MKRRLECALVLAATVAVLVLPSTALAVNIFHFRGLGASAYFSSVDATGCIYTEAYLFASDERMQSPPGNGSSGSLASLGIYQYDACTWAELNSGWGWAELDDTALQVSRDLALATLNATIEVCTWYGGKGGEPGPATCTPVEVALTWTAGGGVVRVRGSFHYQTPDYQFNGHTNRAYRAAVATGTIFDGAVNYAAQPTLHGETMSVRSGQVAID